MGFLHEKSSITFFFFVLILLTGFLVDPNWFDIRIDLKSEVRWEKEREYKYMKVT